MFKFLRNSTPIYIQKVYYNYHMLIHMFHVYRVNYSRIRYAVYALQVFLILHECAYCAYRICFNFATVSIQPLRDRICFNIVTV